MGATHPDRSNVDRCIEKLKGILNNIDRETGRAHTRILMEELASQLVLKKGQAENTVKLLELDSPEREIFFSGVVERYKDAENDSMRIKMFLLDNFLILTEDKDKRKKEGSTLKLFCDVNFFHPFNFPLLLSFSKDDFQCFFLSKPINIELVEFMEEGEMELRLATRAANAAKEQAQENSLRPTSIFRGKTKLPFFFYF